MSMGVVGTRHPTPYGMAAAERLAGDLARAGVTIVSGMARGIDTAAHKAALAGVEGTTVAVWGAESTSFIPPKTGNWRPKLPRRG